MVASGGGLTACSTSVSEANDYDGNQPERISQSRTEGEVYLCFDLFAMPLKRR